MRTDIHPKYAEMAVTCSCGNKFTTNSTYTKGDLHIEICSNCHPFYTGTQKIIDTAGRVDRFKKRFRRKSDGAEKAAEKDQES